MCMFIDIYYFLFFHSAYTKLRRVYRIIHYLKICSRLHDELIILSSTFLLLT